MARSGVTHRELVEILCTLLRNFVRLILGNFMPDCYGKSVGPAASGPPREFSVIDKSLAPLCNAVAEAIAGLAGESAASPAAQMRALALIGPANPCTPSPRKAGWGLGAGNRRVAQTCRFDSAHGPPFGVFFSWSGPGEGALDQRSAT
jgi:hypothetical protein